jgi:hypothetical protein
MAADSVKGQELAVNAIDSSHMQSSSVGVDEIAGDAVGAGELVELHEHRSGLVEVVDGNAHNGVYESNTGTVTCGAGEQLLDASIDWIDDQGHEETALREIEIERAGDDSAEVTGIFDGGGAFQDPATFQAVATCIGS